jgi:hypothetical protein
VATGVADPRQRIIFRQNCNARRILWAELAREGGFQAIGAARDGKAMLLHGPGQPRRCFLLVK